MSITRESSIDDEDFRKISETNFQKIRSKSAKIGYADGVSDGMEQTFQTSFNKGYSDGLRTGFEIEKYNSISHNLKNYNEELSAEQSLFLDVIVNAAKKIKHIRPDYQKAECLNTVSQLQNCYINNFLKQCKQSLPLTTNLLCTQNVD